MNDETRTEKTTVLLVYVGVVQTGKNNFHAYMEVSEDMNDGRSLDIYDGSAKLFPKELGPAPIGNLCRSTKEGTDEAGRFLWGQGRNFNGYAGKWANEDDRAEWQARTKAINTAQKNKSKATTDKYKDVDNNIEKIARLYRKLPTVQREAFLSYVLHGIISKELKNKSRYDDEY